ncbi:MAG TPA: rod shape-determining protein MreC [Steroidobacteraceae bacterium]|nr:rod shape-determining protein MreC [Steroidobacteraceae bacterium]
MAAFGTGAGRPLSGRGGSPGFRFTLFAVLSVVLMYLDQRGHYLERVRFVLQTAAYPIQLAVNSPPAAWQWFKESVQTRQALQAENARLRQSAHDLELRTMRYEALSRENGELRGLRAALPPVADRWLPAEIVNIQQSSLRQRLLVNRGGANGVFKGQAVLDDQGLIGQTTHVGLWSAEVILITDPEHAVPVRVERTGLRTIAVGAGDATSLALPYLPANADIKSGDLLVTSGLGGVFPEGYPVGRVTEVHRDAVQPLAQVRAAPLAHLDTDTEVMLVWFRADHPAAPTTDTAGELKHGNSGMQPQAAPPKPRPAPPAAVSSEEETTPTPTPAQQTTGAPRTAPAQPATAAHANRAPASAPAAASPAPGAPSAPGAPPARGAARAAASSAPAPTGAPAGATGNAPAAGAAPAAATTSGPGNATVPLPDRGER